MASRWTTEGDNVNVMSDDTTDSEESRKERANHELIEMLIYGRTTALVTGGILGVLLAWWWLALPLRQRSHSSQD
jgi:hypothetical protein